MRNRTVSRVAAFTICLGLIASCGSDDSTISKPEFVAKADAICTQYNDALEEKTSELASDATEEQVLAFVTDVLVPESGIDIDSRRVTVCEY